MECPKLLQLTEDELSARMRRIEMAGIKSPTLVALKFALPSKRPETLKKVVNSYLSKRGKHSNLLRDVAGALGCSSEDMMEILARNPRLVGVKPRKDLVEKIQLLRDCGARLEDLRRSTNLLNNKTLNVIQNRAQLLVDLGLNDPLPVGYIGLSDTQFSAVVARLSGEQRGRPAAGTRSDDVNYVVDQLPPLTCRRLIKIKPKIEYLLSEGYSPAEVVKCPRILDINISLLRSTVSELMQYSIVRVDLDQCYHYANRGQFSKSRVFINRQLADVLNCSRKEIPLLPTNYCDSSLIGIDEMRANYQFLINCGFQLSDILSVPLILLHPCDAVRQNFNELNNANSCSRARDAYLKFSDNRCKQLNLILYMVEQATGFGSLKSQDSDEFSNSSHSDSDKLTDNESSYKYNLSFNLGYRQIGLNGFSMYDGSGSTEDGCLVNDWGENSRSVTELSFK